MEQYILALDQGTTSSRAILFNHDGDIKGVAQKEFKQYFPKPGWVEHDPAEIWESQAEVVRDVLRKSGVAPQDIAAIGITNQRETTVVWDKETGEPLHKAIVWQDRRTAEFCDSLKEKNLAPMIQEKTGLVIDAYFSGTKLKWILDNVDGARKKAEQGKLAFGTIDSWLIWKLTDGQKHVTDVSNASRTLLFNINTLQWDEEMLELMQIPESMLPEVCSSSEVYGEATTLFNHAIPIGGIAGDQQAALFGQMCTEPGMLKNTYGTGCFLMLNTGEKPIKSKNNLLTTIAWKIGDTVNYALEGSIFIGGAVVQWLRDGLGIIKESADVEKLADKVEDNGGVYLVPAFAGLGAPHWDQFARGTIVGITRGTTAAHIGRAALESIAFQTYDVVKAMEGDSGIKTSELRVDGGATVNQNLMQFQSDILDVALVRPKILETTALGAAYLAGLAVGFWENLDEIKKQWQVDQNFKPQMQEEQRSELLGRWHKALERSKEWI
jgi:glycerol kinase